MWWAFIDKKRSEQRFIVARFFLFLGAYLKKDGVSQTKPKGRRLVELSCLSSVALA
jgi:hypothetical protein